MLSNDPKILVIGQSFNKTSGGGITITNLFSKWSKEKLGLVTFASVVKGNNMSIVERVYQLGVDEISVSFPLKYFKTKHASGRVIIDSDYHKEKIIVTNNNNYIREVLYNSVFYVIKKSGLYVFMEKMYLSKNLKNFIDDFKPDFIYTQLGSIAMIGLILQINRRYQIPIIVHIMDDWPSTISGFMKPITQLYNERKIKKVFRESSILLSISDEMSREYEKRYGGNWVSFYNSIDISMWDKKNPEDFIKNQSIFKIAYFGRIGIANEDSLLLFAEVVRNINVDGKIIEFHIYTFNIKNQTKQRLKKLKNVFIHAPVKHNELPNKVRLYDLLLLPLDFSKRGVKYAQYSIPTKMSEYMISGVPFLVFAPQNTAVSKFVLKEKVGFVLSEKNIKSIHSKLKQIVRNKELREKYSKKAFNVASVKNNIISENMRFKKVINKLIN